MNPRNATAGLGGHAVRSASPIDPAIRRLDTIAARIRVAVLSERLLLLIAACSGLVLVAVLLDAAFRWPMAIRLAILAAIVVFAFESFRRLILPVIRFRPTALDIALRIERRTPALSGRLAAAIDFGVASRSGGVTSPIVASAVGSTASSIDASALALPIRTERIRRAIAAILVAAVAIGVPSALLPQESRIGLERTLLPWSDAQWPARTALRSLVEDGSVAARGRPFVLAASLEKGDPARERVEALYRLERNGEKGPWERIVLTRQQDRRFERRIPSDADSIEFLFETDDFETPIASVRLVTPPEIVDAAIEIEPPAYATASRSSRRFELGPGTDRRSTVPAAQLAGSLATLSLELSKPMPAPDQEAIPSTLPGLPETATVRLESSPSPRWIAEWTLEDPTTIEPRLRDEHGLESLREPSFRVDVVADEPPSVAVLDPARDESVLATAVIEISAEARDDVAVESASILAARGDRAEEPLAISIEARSSRRRFESTLSLESLGAVAGDLVEIVATATDGYPGRDAVRSQPRTLRVVGEAEFARQVRDELAAIRRAAIRVDESQQAVLEQAARGEAEAASSQAQVSQRLSALADATRSISERLLRNRPQSDRDPELVAQASSRIEEAREASRSAEESLREAEARESGGQSETDGATSEGASEQASEQASSQPSDRASERAFEPAAESVRREVQALVSLLEQDEDTWSLLRELENLASEVSSLESESRELGEETAGRSREDLDASQRAELDALARRQSEAASAAERLLEEIAERAERVADRDAAQAEALRQAAQEARQSRLEQEMREAAQELSENRTDAAQQSQQAAQQALERMQRTLEDTRKVRTETLRRLMTELVDSIEALLRRAELESAALRSLLADGPSWPESALRERSNAAVMLERNTRAVETQAASGGEDAAEVARALDRAASAQSQAIVELRAAPPEVGNALGSIDRSITLLREALEAARRGEADAEREAARQAREELAAAYRALADRQRLVATATEDLSERIERGEIAARRRLAETRRAASEQETVGEEANSLEAKTEAIAEAGVFSQSHDWIDRWSREATERLRGGETDREVRRRQARIEETALAMAESLEALAEEDDPFTGDSQSAASGGGGGGAAGGEDGAIPPIAELRLLKSMQEQVYRSTRAYAEEPPGEGVVADARREALRELASMQRSIRELGEALLAKLEEQNARQQAGEGVAPEIVQPEGDESVGDTDEPSSGVAPIGVARRAGDEPSGAGTAKKPPTGSPPASPAAAQPPPSLDELLGIEEEAEVDQAAEAAAAESARRVAERLRERPIADDFREAIAQMAASESLLEEAAAEDADASEDLGLGTQRVQEEILRRLEALIQSAQRQRQRQQQQSSSSSSSSSSESEPSQGEQAGASSTSSESRQEGAAAEGGEAMPPAFEEAQLGAMLEEGRVEWGNLPERVRELVRQGRRDRVSSIYRRLTEQYYRRLAEEARP